jgi:hypothetical protein
VQKSLPVDNAGGFLQVGHIATLIDDPVGTYSSAPEAGDEALIEIRVGFVS